MGFSILDSTYAAYFSSIHAKSYIVRTAFVFLGIFNILGKLLSGLVLDRSEEAPVICSLVGNALMLLPYLSLATLPYWLIENYNRQWVVLGGSPTLSCGFVFIFLSTLLRMNHMKFEHVQGQDTATLVSGKSNCLNLPLLAQIHSFNWQGCGVLLIVWGHF